MSERRRKPREKTSTGPIPTGVASRAEPPADFAPTAALTFTSPGRFRWWVAAAAVVLLGVGSALWAPRLRYGPRMTAPAWVNEVRVDRLSSDYCISCHEAAGQQWRGSHHQLANRPISASHPAAHFDGAARTFASDYRFALDQGSQPLIEEQRHTGTLRQHRPTMAIAHDPLRQFLIETRPGTFQATEVAWDPAKQDWFGVFGSEGRNPGEWGHWTGQSMNWNSMCARCHMTAYNKAYDETNDTYQSTWAEHGVGCVQCHGPMTGHEPGGAAFKRVRNISRDAPVMIQTCAACHARAEDLTASMPPGENFDDHFRLQLMTESRLYRADGQILDEDFEWGSFRHSKMGAAGVTCLDCHNAHSGKLKLPLENNSICLQCHSAGNTRNAPVVDPVAHSFHKPGTAGSRCVDCHMAETTYMQRDPRRDHGFIIPDPGLNREWGIPDACSRCHADQTVQWNLDAFQKWYGESAQTIARRERTRAVARAYRGEVAVVPELRRLLLVEKNPAWQASLLGLADQLAPADETVLASAGALRVADDPMVRAAAIRALARDPAAAPLLRAALNDPVRLVRLDAALALSPELGDGTKARVELDEYLNAMAENPIARLRRGQDRFRRGRLDAAIADLRAAIARDPLAAPLPEALGQMFNAMGRPQEAAEQFERAAALAPTDALAAFSAGLAWAEAGDVRGEKLVREATQRNPGYARAWYNLGLLLNQRNRTSEALAALARGEEADPTDGDIPFAAATMLARERRTDEAKSAVERALVANPQHDAARQLRSVLERGER